MIYNIEQSGNWENIDNITYSIQPEKFKILNQLILQVQIPKIQNIRTEGIHYKSHVISNFFSSLLLGSGTYNTITSAIGAISFMVFSRSHQEMPKNDNLSVWIFNNSVTVVVQDVIKATLTLTDLFFLVMSNIFKTAVTLLRKPIVSIPLSIVLIGVGGVYATKFIFNVSIQIICDIASKSLSATPAIGKALFNATYRLVPAVLLLALQVASIAFNVLVFVPRTILGI